MSRLMGLFVVGRLAQRHGIRVQLRPSTYGGVTAFIRLPAELITSVVTDIERETPVVEPVGSDTETSPIFEALQSEWFTNRAPVELPKVNGGTHPPLVAPGWQSRPSRSGPSPRGGPATTTPVATGAATADPSPSSGAGLELDLTRRFGLAAGGGAADDRSRRGHHCRRVAGPGAGSQPAAGRGRTDTGGERKWQRKRH